MNHKEFLKFREQLQSNLEPHPAVTGLVFVGSAADVTRADEWSDHDFFVFTSPGTAEEFRQNLEWIPDYDNISFYFRETDHGLKVVYKSGHVLEFAVFDDDIVLAGVNAYEVALDKADIAGRLAAAKVGSIPQPLDVDKEFPLLLSHLLFGTGRYRRGEVLAANQFIIGFCVTSVMKLADVVCVPANGFEDSVDNQNPLRRFELRHPELASELAELQRLDLDSAARGILNIVIHHLSVLLTDERLEHIAVVKARLGW